MNSNRGFSLVELIVVIAIMAIISAVAIPVYNTYITKAEDSVTLQKIDDRVYCVKLANIEYNTKSEAIVTETQLTVNFFGDKSETSAIQVGQMTEITPSGSSLVMEFENPLSDGGETQAVESVYEINTYNSPVTSHNSNSVCSSSSSSHKSSCTVVSFS